jgi:hypothetical protein
MVQLTFPSTPKFTKYDISTQYAKPLLELKTLLIKLQNACQFYQILQKLFFYSDIATQVCSNTLAGHKHTYDEPCDSLPQLSLENRLCTFEFLYTELYLVNKRLFISNSEE